MIIYSDNIREYAFVFERSLMNRRKKINSFSLTCLGIEFPISLYLIPTHFRVIIDLDKEKEVLR